MWMLVEGAVVFYTNLHQRSCFFALSVDLDIFTICCPVGFKCPVCSKFVSSDEMDLHLVMCLTKPRITYNEDVLGKDAGECAICLEELQQGDTIARLPCLCIYHKGQVFLRMHIKFQVVACSG
ncbi:hypothetical protein Q9233_013357 [Columba guinea]|nr:hypothetical protein Q9233_013357 [Columba guinea]